MDSPGAVAVVLGCRAVTWSSITVDGTANLYQSGGANERLGGSVSTLGDLDGDGLDDLLLGAWGWAGGSIQMGRTYVVPSPYAP